ERCSSAAPSRPAGVARSYDVQRAHLFAANLVPRVLQENVIKGGAPQTDALDVAGKAANELRQELFAAADRKNHVISLDVSLDPIALSDFLQRCGVIARP